jgi:hypothetical protein
MKNPVKAALWLGLIALGFVWRPAWAILAVVVFADWAEGLWEQLLNAIRGRHQGLSEGEEKKYESPQESERQIEIAHQESQYKHIPGLPWGDPSSYAKASTAEELERAREALNRWAAEKYEREAKLALEQERKRLDDENREQEAREYLVRESERVQREREQREEREGRRKPQEHEPEPIASAPLIIVRPPSQEAEAELCKCGYPGCLGHEVIKGQIIFPGFTSEAAMAQSPHELVCLNVEVTGVAGNPSDGALPASAIRSRREPRK